jgi:hypothetical protein
VLLALHRLCSHEQIAVAAVTVTDGLDFVMSTNQVRLIANVGAARSLQFRPVVVFLMTALGNP